MNSVSLLSTNFTKGTATMMNLTIDGTTNRITGSNFAYDAVGNMTSMPFSGGAQTFTYDHDNRVTAATNSGGTETYGYDAMNKRILKTKNGVTDVYFYGLSGELLGRYRWKQWSGGVWGWEMKETFAYFAGIRVARRDGATPVSLSAWSAYRHDRLSSVGDGSTYLPYGEERSVTANDTHKFATYYRDSSSGLDYADQRYYSSTYGRFLTSDPAELATGAHSPQSVNKYSYSANDPVNLADTTGQVYGLPPWCFAQGFMSSGGWQQTVTCSGPSFSAVSWFFLMLRPPVPTGGGPTGGGGGPVTVLPPCQIELWYRPIPIEGYNHAYLRVSYSTTQGSVSRIIEGGPSGSFPFFGSLVAQTYPTSNPSLPSNKQWGEPFIGDEACVAIHLILQAVAAYNSHPVSYNPVLGPNSNSYVRHMLKAANVTHWVGAPPDTWAWSVALR